MSKQRGVVSYIRHDLDRLRYMLGAGGLYWSEQLIPMLKKIDEIEAIISSDSTTPIAAPSAGSAGQAALSVSDVTTLAKKFGATVTPGFDDQPPVVRLYDSQLRHFANSLAGQAVDQQARGHAPVIVTLLDDLGLDINDVDGPGDWSPKQVVAIEWLRSLAHPETPNKEPE